MQSLIALYKSYVTQIAVKLIGLPYKVYIFCIYILSSFASTVSIGRQRNGEHTGDSLCFEINLSFSFDSVTYDLLTLGNLLNFFARLFWVSFYSSMISGQ